MQRLTDKSTWLHVDNTENFEFDVDIAGIPGLRWERVTSLGGGGGSIRLTSTSISTLIDRDGNAGEYPHYGIHQFQADGLVFVRGNDRLYVDLVDCRVGSPTLHKALVLHTRPDSSRCLRIPPGVAHRPGPLAYLLTWNLLVPYWDPKVPAPKDGFDVINSDKDTEPEDMPIVEAARWEVPQLWLPAYLRRMAQAALSQAQYPVKRTN